jgi:hypothetical protein
LRESESQSHRRLVAPPQAATECSLELYGGDDGVGPVVRRRACAAQRSESSPPSLLGAATDAALSLAFSNDVHACVAVLVAPLSRRAEVLPVAFPSHSHIGGESCAASNMAVDLENDDVYVAMLAPAGDSTTTISERYVLYAFNVSSFAPRLVVDFTS